MGGYVDDVNVSIRSAADSGLRADGWSFGSGWTVNTSGSTSSGTAQVMPPWVIYVALGVGLLYAIKRMRGK